MANIAQQAGGATSRFHGSVFRVATNPFSTAVPLWAQTTQIVCSLSPKWDRSRTVEYLMRKLHYGTYTRVQQHGPVCTSPFFLLIDVTGFQ